MNNQQLSHLFHIQKASKEGRLVAFVGAGVSANSGIPTWSKLISEMKLELPNNLCTETDDLKIAQLYKDSRGHKEYLDKVKDVLKYNKAIPNPIHKVILDLKPCHIITTNYDDLIEQEIRNEYRQFALIREDKDLPNMAYPNSLIKMHGDYETDNIVLSENDYYNYQRNFPLLRSFVLSLFASKLVIFIGFSFADLNLKMILNELKSILSENMQRVYLLSIDKPDDATLKYYDKKGINIVHFEQDEINEIIALCPDSPKVSENNLPSFSGRYIYNVLYAINHLRDDYQLDLVTSLYNKIEAYKDEIKVFGDGLKYLLPKKEIQCWNQHSSGLQLYSPYFDSLAKQLKTINGKKQFIQNHRNIDRVELKRIAYYNYLYSIDSIQVLSDYFFNHLDKYFETSAQTYLLNFDFDKFKKRLRIIRSRDLSCSIDDLEFPFVLYKLGDYYGAYQQYNRILPLAWNRQKYILYFVCLYNIRAIKNGIRFQLFMSNEINIDPVIEKIESINFEETLSRLPIPDEIRKIFQDLLSYRSIGERSIETEELKEELHQQRKSAENGGCSINSNIHSLLGKYIREFKFCNDNYIISDNNQYYQSVCKNTVLGILNSFATPDTQFYGVSLHTTKIDKIDELSISILIHSIGTKELFEILKQYEIDSLELDEKACAVIKTYISNINRTDYLSYIDNSFLLKRIGNLLLILSITKEIDCDINAIYNIIFIFWSKFPHNSSFIQIVKQIIGNFKPNTDIAQKLLNHMLYKTDGLYYSTGCAKYLSSIISKENLLLDDIRFDDIKDKMSEFIYPLYVVSSDSCKSQITDYCTKNMCDLIHYLDFIIHYNTCVTSSDTFDKLINRYSTDIEYNKASICSMLVQIRALNQYSCIFSAIDHSFTDNECFHFFQDPIHFSKEDIVHPEWILRCTKLRFENS